MTSRQTGSGNMMIPGILFPEWSEPKASGIEGRAFSSLRHAR